MREILLVEDSDNDAALVRRALNVLSVANPVCHISTGDEAMRYLDRAAETSAIALTAPSVIFLDLILPGTSGLQILQHIVHHSAFAKTLRVVLTNMSDIDTIRRAYSLGANSFLVKPVQVTDLTELIKAFPGHWSFHAQTYAEKIPSGPAVPAK